MCKIAQKENNMNDWTLSTEHPGYRCKTIERGNYSVTILRPVLEEHEAAKRESHVKTAAESVLKKYIKRR
jgi:hypothetical protein